ncbi:MAG TPA: cation transporter [Gammaproteobacteria bacterium]|nr:cation transporter [Gammaproteobacteria bacterium]
MPHHHHSTDRIGWAFFLNASFTIVEFIGGWLTNSTAIMADAVHDLGDSLAIGTAWVLNNLGKKSPDATFTYGYRRLSLFGALFNSIVLIVGSVWILSTAIPRLFHPVMPMVEGMLGLAVLGICVNGLAAYRLSGGQTLNEKILNWHLLEDVLGWVAVLIVSIVLYFFDWPILDPLLSIGFTLYILINVMKNLWKTLKIFAQSTPNAKLRSEVLEKLNSLQQIQNTHHLHLWSLDGESHVLTAHLVLAEAIDVTAQCKLKQQVADALKDLNLTHTTIELEFPDEACRDECANDPSTRQPSN